MPQKIPHHDLATPATDFESAFDRVKRLVSDFADNEHYYLNSDYSEAAVRQDYIDKFLAALGWDVRHVVQRNPYEQEVKVERGVRIGGRKKKADYAFSLAPEYDRIRFIVEAKRPSRNLLNADDYFQTVRYGYASGTPLAVLTDFEEFHITDSRYRPDIETALSTGVEKFHYTQYANEASFRRIYHLFSREAVVEGAIERRAAKLARPSQRPVQRGLFPGGYLPLDESFLLYLKGLRIALAQSFYEANPSLRGGQLTEAAQRTIDRLIFMRFLEDRLIEPDPIISEFGERGDAWADFVRTGKRLNAKYNGVVFREHFTDNPRFTGPAVFPEVCADLSHFNTPYNFSQIPLSTLGSIYEEFLGEVLILDGERVVATAAPEARRAGGVYYTPTYVVSRIVEQTVVQGIEGRSPQALRSFRVADLACGSGSFLLGTFDALLRHHGRWYNDNPKAAKRDGCHQIEGQWVLSLRQKREILTRNIFGVDIDHQAVEVAQLSLFLKLLEDETTATANDVGVLFKEKILPDLGGNVVSGNSLIGFDRFQGTLFGDDVQRVNPLDFTEAFPAVMSEGGFDVILGNPPYVSIETLRAASPTDIPYYLANYKTAGTGRWDLYLLFVERGLALLKRGGVLGYILPNRLFTTDYAEGLRGLVTRGRHVRSVVDFGDQQVFRGATTYTCLLYLSERPQDEVEFVAVADLEAWRETGDGERVSLPHSRLESAPWNITTGLKADVVSALEAGREFMLADIMTTHQGVRTSANDVYVLKLDAGSSLKDEVVQAFSEALGKRIEIESLALRPFLQGGKEIRPFHVDPTRYVVVWPYRTDHSNVELIREDELADTWPLAHAYLSENRKRLDQRKMDRPTVPGGWYAYGRHQNIAVMPCPKILVPDNADRASFAYDLAGHYVFVTGYALRVRPGRRESPLYALGLLNSSVLDLYVRHLSPPMTGGFFRYFSKYLKPLPLPEIDFSNPVLRGLHDEVVALSSQIIDTSGSGGQSFVSDADARTLSRGRANLIHRLDHIAYELYGLSSDAAAVCDAHRHHLG